VKSRARAAVFAAGALACAGLSAAVAGSAQEPAGDLGSLTSVVVTSAPLDRGTPVGGSVARESLAVRRVPESFVPPDALGAPGEAMGRRLATGLPAGSYLTASAFKASRPGGTPRGGLPRGTAPVEIDVTGAGALAGARTSPGERVDVVVSGDSAPGPSAGRTYVAASGVPIL
jgi:pilus assembly protein CpaB